jgi:E3 ubiquitin-protein ligase MYCBP2
VSRKERSVRGPRTRRSRSPGTASRSMITDQEPARLGISPSTAECLRAVFAATLWHQGLVQDAMACASFLKFHPDLPKQPDCVLLRGDR